MEEQYKLLFQWILIISIIETFSMAVMKESTKQDDKKELYIGMLGYAAIAYFLWKSLHYKGIGIVNLMWNCITLVTGFMIGYLLFEEKINRYTMLAMIFALMSIYFAYLSEK
jgi:multidrug transporter EmrE-like cation transporter